MNDLTEYLNEEYYRSDDSWAIETEMQKHLKLEEELQMHAREFEREQENDRGEIERLYREVLVDDFRKVFDLIVKKDIYAVDGRVQSILDDLLEETERFINEHYDPK